MGSANPPNEARRGPGDPPGTPRYPLVPLYDPRAEDAAPSPPPPDEEEEEEDEESARTSQSAAVASAEAVAIANPEDPEEEDPV